MELCVIACTSMNLTEKLSLAYLKGKGFKMSQRKFYYVCGHISAETRKRAYEYAKNFLEDHISVIDELKNIKKMMYEHALKEEDHFKSSIILVKITETIIPYISAYIESTNEIIIEEVKNKIGKEEKSFNLSNLGV